MIDPVNIGGVLDPRVRRGALGRGGDQIFADRADEWRKLNRQSNSAQNGAHDARARVMTILGYAIDSIRGKLSALRELGFSDPAKIITSLPAILGYAPERLHLAPGMRTS